MNYLKRSIWKAPSRILLMTALFFYCVVTNAQLNWKKVTASFAPLPIGIEVYKTTDSLDGKPFIAYYAIAELKNKQLEFTTDTTYKRRLTPAQFFEKNNHPLLVVNTSFFSFETNQNLNIVIKNGQLVSYNVHSLPGKGKDTFTYRHSFTGALGITKKRTADVAWTFTDSSQKIAYASQSAITSWKDSVLLKPFKKIISGNDFITETSRPVFKKMEDANWRGRWPGDCTGWTGKNFQ